MLTEVVDRHRSVTEFGAWRLPMIKHVDDLARYAKVIEATQPQALIECGSWSGHSARWFASLGLDVLSIDIAPDRAATASDGVRALVGDTCDPGIIEQVTAWVDGRRCMVSLDSDHCEHHVRREIELYRELVSPGCYLVVEDGIIDWLTAPKPLGCDVFTGSVLAAIEDMLDHDDRFSRDLVVEAMTSVTMFPAGWWLRDG